ncbi:MAG: uracil-DNA glycosylase [Pseudomonadota bacterium]
MTLSAEQRHTLALMGITVWAPREDTEPAPSPNVSDRTLERPTRSREVANPLSIDPVLIDPLSMDWPALRQAVKGCHQCTLCETRTNTVFGVGAERADWMIVGEAPGANEDRQGEPFVGRAGQLLNSMLGAIGLARDAVFIANTLKCRPPGNRDPKPGETAACAAFLVRQLQLVRPKVILAVGRIAAQTLLESEQSLGRMRGRVHRYRPTDTPLVVTYHPAYLLRSPDQKRSAWQDLKLAVEVVSSP